MTEPRYCLHYTCSKVLVQRPKETELQYSVRKYCSVRCSNATHDRHAPHGRWRAVRLHWLRSEKACHLCQAVIDYELDRMARATA
jgi:hypothetical protein